MNSTACGHRHFQLNSKLFDSFFASVICDWMFDVAGPGMLYASSGIQRSRISGTSALPFALNHLAPVAQKLDTVIHRINPYPTDKCQGNQLRYPVDSDLSGGQRYPPFEQLGTVQYLNETKHFIKLTKRKDVLILLSFRLCSHPTGEIGGENHTGQGLCSHIRTVISARFL